jgi:DNA-binding transcriptional ArsR family regulator
VPKQLPVLDVSAPICCAPVGAGAVAEDEALEVALRMKALADPNRVRLMSILLSADSGEACGCDLAPMVGLTDATVSHHLGQLFKAGLVTRERRGMNVYYAPDREALGALTRVIDPACC